MHESRKIAALSALLLCAGCAEDPETNRERQPSTEAPSAPIATELEPIAPSAACTAITERAAIALGTAAAEAEVNCTSDADCTVVVPATSCAALCAVAVARRGAERIAAVIEAQNDASCIAFEARGCALLPPQCLNPLNVACLQGECAFIYAE